VIFKLKKRLTKVATAETITAILVFLFLYTGLSKYFEFSQFRSILSNSILSPQMAGLVAAILPGFEISLVVLLVLPKTRLWGLYLSMGLLIACTLYILWMIGFAPHLPCNCGGVINRLSWKEYVFFNLFFLFLSGIGIRLQSSVTKNKNE